MPANRAGDSIIEPQHASNRRINRVICKSETLRPAFLFCLLSLVLSASPVLSAGLKLQACDEDFRQLANWLCTQPGEKTPCYKFYFSMDEWKEKYTEASLNELGDQCCKENGCSVTELKQHCCFEDTCRRVCYNSN